MIRVAGIIVRNGRGYVPTEAVVEGGPYILVEPIYTVNLTAREVIEALKSVIDAGHPEFSSLTHEEWQRRKDPILEVAGVRSWKELAKGGASYTIEWSEDSVTLYVSRLDHKGRFEVDPTKTNTFPRQTPIETIVGAILKDVRSRPELFDD
jgi:hypothetical protein